MSCLWLVLIAGCSTPQTVADPSPYATEALSAYNQVDVGFAQMMIPHHADAIAMAQVLLETDGVDPEIREIAAAIDEAQRAENATMNQWLAARQEQTVQETAGMAFDPAAIREATATEVETAFLEQMILHHEHGTGMARQAAAQGQSSTMIELSESMVEMQTREVQQMRQHLTR